MSLDWLDLEMEPDETENKTLEILYQIVEHPEAFWIPKRQRSKQMYLIDIKPRELACG